jgi:hypothetical protein
VRDDGTLIREITNAAPGGVVTVIASKFFVESKEK